MRVVGMVGALERDAVEAAFAAARGDVKACIDATNQGLPFEEQASGVSRAERTCSPSRSTSTPTAT